MGLKTVKLLLGTFKSTEVQMLAYVEILCLSHNIRLLYTKNLLLQ